MILFRHETDARRVLEVLPKRFGKYGLALHPDKTRLIPFRRPPYAAGDKAMQGDRPGAFDLLGFTHYWGRTRRGGWAVMRQTSSEATEPGSAEHCSVVSGEPASPDQRPARGIESEGARTLRVLRDHRQHANVVLVPCCSSSRVAEVAQSPQSTTRDDLGPIQPAATPFPAAAATDRPLIRQVANPYLEEPYALMCARMML